MDACAEMSKKTRADTWIACGNEKETGKAEKGGTHLTFRAVGRGRGREEKSEKNIKIFKKGLAYSRKIEYNVEDVCKGDETADCSLAGEGTAADHVRQSDDGSRTVYAGQKPSKPYLSTNKEEKKWPARKFASSSGLTSTCLLYTSRCV